MSKLKVEEYKPKTTLRLENDMAQKMMDDYDVDDEITCMIKGKVVSKSIESYDGKQRPCMTIEVKSVGKDSKDMLHEKMSGMKMKKEKA